MYPPVGFDPSDVTGAVPPIHEHLVGRLRRQIPRHQRLAAGLNLPHLAGSKHLTAVEVDHAQFDAAWGESCGVETPLVGSIDRIAGQHGQLAGSIGR